MPLPALSLELVQCWKDSELLCAQLVAGKCEVLEDGASPVCLQSLARAQERHRNPAVVGFRGREASSDSGLRAVVAGKRSVLKVQFFLWAQGRKSQSFGRQFCFADHTLPIPAL